MWLKTPESIQNVIWEGQIEPVSNETVARLVRENRMRGTILNSDDLRSGLPIVSIGSPEIWPLTDLYPNDKIPPY